MHTGQPELLLIVIIIPGGVVLRHLASFWFAPSLSAPQSKTFTHAHTRRHTNYLIVDDDDDDDGGETHETATAFPFLRGERKLPAVQGAQE